MISRQAIHKTTEKQKPVGFAILFFKHVCGISSMIHKKEQRNFITNSPHRKLALLLRGDVPRKQTKGQPNVPSMHVSLVLKTVPD